MNRHHVSRIAYHASHLTSELDQGRQAQAQEYALIRRRLFFVDLAINLLLFVLLLPTGLSVGLRDFAEGLAPAGWWWLALIIYVVVLGVAYTVINLPLSYYSGYVLRRRYGLSRETAAGWLADQVKESVVGAALGVPTVLVVYALLRYAPDTWWLIATVLALLFTVVLAQLAPVLLLPLFNKLTPLPDGELKSRLLNMAAKAGSPVHGVFVMDLSRRTSEANAMFTGIGPTRRIILGDTMLGDYGADEIETVLAHELAHQVHGDLWRGIALQAALIIAGFWLTDLALRSGADLLGLRGIDDIAGLPLVAAVFAVFGLLLLPATNAFSRYMERAADTYALQVTGKPAAFKSVMAKLAGQNLSEANPPAWVRLLFYSHPPIAERMAMADAYADGLRVKS